MKQPMVIDTNCVAKAVKMQSNLRYIAYALQPTISAVFMVTSMITIS